jgi:magnesium transporter
LLSQHAQAHLNNHRGWTGILQPRDVRVFDPSFSHSHDPEVLVRRHSVLINLDPVKALVLRNLCLVFVPAGADGLLGGILLRARELQSDAQTVGEGQEPTLPFELMMYESVFASVCANAEDEYHELRPEAKNTLSSVLKSSSGPILVQLRNMEQRLGYLVKKVADNRYALNEVLESDRNMALMMLGEVARHPERFIGPDEENWTADHESVELLVESYLQRLDSVLAGLRDLQEELTSVRAITTLRLSSAQNKLLSVDLLVKCVTAAMTYASLFGAVFGMNLNSGIEFTEGIFWPLFFAVSIGSPLSIVCMFWAIKSRGLMIS